MNAIAEFVKKRGKKPALRRKNLQSMHYIPGIETYSAYKISEQKEKLCLCAFWGCFLCTKSAEFYEMVHIFG